jgi:mono/diheme cytochrome c family protein
MRNPAAWAIHKGQQMSARSHKLVLLIAPILSFSILEGAYAQPTESVEAGHRLAKESCAQCHGVDKKGYSANPSAPAFEDIANVPGMTRTALTVAMRTSHRSMPNLVIEGRDAADIITYILSLKEKQ